MRDRRKRVALIDYDARKRALKSVCFAVFTVAIMIGVFTAKDALLQPTSDYASHAASPSMPTVSYAPSQPSRPPAQTTQPLTPAQIERIRWLIQQSAAASVTQSENPEDQSAQYLLDRR